MSKIYIVGSVSSGKTTFARELSKKLSITHYELDAIVHVQTDGGSYKRTPAEQAEEIYRINSLGGWLIEGTYRQSCKCLLDISERIIFLDTTIWLRLYRILNRLIRQKLHIEPCLYKPDLHMLRMMFKWTFDFEKNRRQFEIMLGCYKHKLIRITDATVTEL